MSEGLPDTSSAAADEGTAAHFIASVCLVEGTMSTHHIGKTVTCWDEADGNSDAGFVLPEGAVERRSFTVTKEMSEFVDTYIMSVWLLQGNDPERGQLFVETRVPFGTVLGDDEQSGTADAIILSADGEEIIVADLKFGFGEVLAMYPVEGFWDVQTQVDDSGVVLVTRIAAPNKFVALSNLMLGDEGMRHLDATQAYDPNPQLALYGVGAIEFLSEFEDLSNLKRVRLVISQPRVRTANSEFVLSIEDLNRFADRAKLAMGTCADAAEGYLRIDADKSGKTVLAWQAELDAWTQQYLSPSEKGCQWCKARGVCPALAKECMSVVAELSDYGVEYEPEVVHLEADNAQLIRDATFDLAEVTPAGTEYLSAAGRKLKTKSDEISALKMHLPMAVIERLYSQLPLIKLWQDALSEVLYAKLQAGEESTLYKLVQGREGNRAWVDAAEAEKQLKLEKLKEDERRNYTVITITQVEALKKEGKVSEARWEKMQPNITRSEGKPTIAPMSDKRPAITIESNIQTFEEEEI
jgi:hypothetical protein